MTKFDSAEMAQKISKINEIRNKKVVTESAKDKKIQIIIDAKQNTDEIKQYDCDKSLKELKEMAILLRQKLDTLESERNLMDVDFSQVLF